MKKKIPAELHDKLIEADTSDGFFTFAAPDGNKPSEVHVLDVDHLGRLIDLYRATGGKDLQHNGYAAKLLEEIDAETAALPNRLKH